MILMRMNDHTKLVFALEHIAHLEDLFKDNIDEAILQSYLNDINSILNRQFEHEKSKRKRV